MFGRIAHHAIFVGLLVRATVRGAVFLVMRPGVDHPASPTLPCASPCQGAAFVAGTLLGGLVLTLVIAVARVARHFAHLATLLPSVRWSPSRSVCCRGDRVLLAVRRRADQRAGSRGARADQGPFARRPGDLSPAPLYLATASAGLIVSGVPR